MIEDKVLESIIEKIKSSKQSLVLAHQNPDGDTLGSMLALGTILAQRGHFVDYCMHDPVPEIYKFLPYVDQVKLSTDKNLLPSYDLAFSLDCGSVKRLGSARNLWEKAVCTINIDHHVSNEQFANINWIHPDATSTGQLVYWLAKELKVKITKEIATLLYTTLLTDTGCFSNSNTNSNALMWAGELIEYGAEHESVYRKVFLERPLKSVKVFGSALSKISILEGGDVVWTFVDDETMKKLETTGEDTEDIADHMMRTKGVKVGVFFREDNNETKVSLRSNIEFDVSKIAIYFGGGGHKKAAGINIKKPLNEVKHIILEKVVLELKNHNGKK